ncbi:uroporphyrinogen decarboxylase family protein [Pontiella sulfatireligans]|uniref:Uroporphyrinogen decarboxylase (URO-D) domain-containing protein n=1 Tax=Pontiella sulfatireligans TaxID=2750658 RepID=A0A6C2USQ7_9BACT|nr:uroporphyrinogen decarboxylase family protein [Pontiella sulfatireligans]VGO21936.1 hypothetical protein SCARR_04016 [Pontiella sulfatireligans]
MTSREKIQNALNHQSGPVPIDFGGGPTSGIHVTCVEQLREYYGLEKRPVKVVEPYQMLGLVEDDLREATGVDTVMVCPQKTMFGFDVAPLEKSWTTPWGQEVLVSTDFNVEEINGEVLIYPEGDRTAEPSGKMPAGGYFFDTICRQEEIDEDHLNPEDNLEEFGPVSDEEIAYFRKEVEEKAKSGRAVFANFGGTALGDIGLVPAPFLKKPKGIRDVSEWYMATLTQQEYVHAIFEKQVEYALGNLEKIHAAVGDAVDAMYLCGTDFGTQSGTFCSPETFKELWLPHYKVMTDWIHTNTAWNVFKHSCGAVESFMEHFIAAGIDIINPVQCSAAGMDARLLKERYGDRLVFWGGGIDTQNVLPFGTPEEVRAQTLERCEIFSENGGFVFNAIHNVQALTPIENLVAMIDAVKEFNR